MKQWQVIATDIQVFVMVCKVSHYILFFHVINSFSHISETLAILQRFVCSIDNSTNTGAFRLDKYERKVPLWILVYMLIQTSKCALARLVLRCTIHSITSDYRPIYELLQSIALD